MKRRIDPETLYELRCELGLTQKALAERAHISSQYVSAIEAGRRQACNPQVGKAIAAALGVSLRELQRPLERAP